MRKQKAIEYFREHASDYAETYTMQNKNCLRAFLLNERMRIVLEMARGAEGRLLDVGCGPAAMMNELREQGLEVWGIDPSLNMIAIGINQVKMYPSEGRIRLLVGDAENLSFTERSFDAVLCIGVLEYLEDALKALNEIARVSKNKSSLILSFPNAMSPFNIIDSWLALISYYFLKITQKFFKSIGKDMYIDDKRMLLSRSVVSQRYSYGAAKGILEGLGYTRFAVKYHGYRFAFLKSFLEKQVIALNQRFNLNESFLSWIGIDCVVCAERG